jgi:hypothetical protein
MTEYGEGTKFPLLSRVLTNTRVCVTRVPRKRVSAACRVLPASSHCSDKRARGQNDVTSRRIRSRTTVHVFMPGAARVYARCCTCLCPVLHVFMPVAVRVYARCCTCLYPVLHVFMPGAARVYARCCTCFARPVARFFRYRDAEVAQMPPCNWNLARRRENVNRSWKKAWEELRILRSSPVRGRSVDTAMTGHFKSDGCVTIRTAAVVRHDLLATVPRAHFGSKSKIQEGTGFKLNFKWCMAGRLYQGFLGFYGKVTFHRL